MYYTVLFNNVDLCDRFGCVLSEFKDVAPEPKTNYVSIPAGSDIDITSALGDVAFSDGEHDFVFVFMGDDAHEDAKAFVAYVNGQRVSYECWDGFAYTGRWRVDNIERIADHCEKVKVSVRHSPYGTRRDTVTLEAYPSTSYALEGSLLYSNVTITLKQPATVTIGSTTRSLKSGTYTLATTTEDTTIKVVLSDWWWYLDGTNVVVNTDHYALDGTNVAFDSSFRLSGKNLLCRYTARQYVTIAYTRKDF